MNQGKLISKLLNFLRHRTLLPTYLSSINMTSLEQVSAIRGNEKEKTIASEEYNFRIRMEDATACMNVKGPKK